MHAFVKSLRSDFQLPSRRTLQRHVSSLYLEVRLALGEQLRRWPYGTLSVDGWEDHQKLEVLGSTVRGVAWDAPSLLTCTGQQFVHQTQENIANWMQKQVDWAATKGCSIIAIIADNANNVQAAGRLIQDKIVLNCLSHSAELLVGDLWGMWPGVEEKATAIETLFRNSHYARAVYAEEAKRQPGGTMLVHPCLTRWGSRAAMLESIVKNRVTIENSLSRLRREKFDNALFASMGWIWTGLVWDDFQQLTRIMTHCSSYVGITQENTCTRGTALEKYIRHVFV